MALLSVTNTFVPGTIIRSADVNQDFADVIAWANGNISDINFATMTGVVTWSVSTNVLGINMTGNGNQGLVAIAQNSAMAAGKAALKVSSNSAQSLADALVEIFSTSSSMNVPSLLITDTGTTGPAAKVVSTTKPTHMRPSMTTTQRNALASPSAGDEIFNTTNVRPEYFNGTNWVSGSGSRTGNLVFDAGGTFDPDVLACDGSAVSRTTYAALFAKIGVAWGVGDGTTTFNLPDFRGRGPLGAGTGTAGNATLHNLADMIGDEQLQSHNHNMTHTHITADPGHNHSLANTGGATVQSGSGASVAASGAGTTGTSFTGYVVQGFTGNTGSAGAGSGENFHPVAVCNIGIVI